MLLILFHLIVLILILILCFQLSLILCPSRCATMCCLTLSLLMPCGCCSPPLHKSYHSFGYGTRDTWTQHLFNAWACGWLSVTKKCGKKSAPAPLLRPDLKEGESHCWWGHLMAGPHTWNCGCIHRILHPKSKRLHQINQNMYISALSQLHNTDDDAVYLIDINYGHIVCSLYLDCAISWGADDVITISSERCIIYKRCMTI